ncbi:serine hydrolase domain-containing protein [Sphingomonas lycopersici]|uniref:Beta-lactamase family protein n=1 Tax=Sphingomonas lycopersici TaxID=2951807 RepID=A0AA42CN64_9SPHN|nr:serine hydrolase domain-containing protein [Sphingomonas lycopersici]MCW6533255.1 beta-lactamase family protein [Sphingomonas lycopersici]
MPVDRLLLSRRRALIGGGALTAAAMLARPTSAGSRFDDLVAAQMAKASIPGLALGVTQNGQVTTTRVYGFADVAHRRPVTRDSMFHIASVTKTVIALAFMRLVDQRRIALDDAIAPHLDFTILGEGASAITFRHLLMHVSGISDARYYDIDLRERGHDARLPLEELLKAYLTKGGRYAGSGNLKSAPGTAWDYSNIGYGLLGHLGSRIAGRDLRREIDEHIFRPMGLRRIAWTIADTPAALRVTPYDVVDGKVAATDPVGFPDWPAGMIRASIGDLTRLVAIVANRGIAAGQRIVSAPAVAAMLDMQRPAGLPAWLSGQGLAWQQSPLGDRPLANHWGGDPGVFTMAYVDPARRTGIALLSNLSATEESRRAMKTIAAAAMRLPG